MTFKKDYINYVLYSAINIKTEGFSNNKRLNNLVSKITSVDDVVKITYLIGKTAGLEFLFKYLLYISDKIDKSQITVFNLKDNFDYDVNNMIKIYRQILNYSSVQSEKIESLPEDETETKSEKEETDSDTIKVESSDEISNLINIEDTEPPDETEDEKTPKLTLIENPESYSEEAEVFELSEIDNPEEQEKFDDESNKDEIKETGEETDENAENDEVFELENLESEIDNKNEGVKKEEIKSDEDEESPDEEIIEKEPEEISDENREEISETAESGFPDGFAEVEVTVNKPYSEEGFTQKDKIYKEESVTNEAYYKFETKFFEEVKILEKLFSTIENDCKTDKYGKLNEKCLQSLTEIIEITSELSNLSRQLSFDLIADIFLTMNLYFTKSISLPNIITSEIVKLLDSSLALVNSLIKGEDYLNYDTIVDKIEKLKKEITRPPEEHEKSEEIRTEEKEEQAAEIIQTPRQIKEEKYESAGFEKQTLYEPVEEHIKEPEAESAVFKMKYLIKEFEKSFISVNDLKGEYSKFDALEKVDELNNALRLIAKISASVKSRDVLKLAEVSYVFLKYIKDYRMDLLEPEIQQIIKYIIFTFKMLLTERKPEDFNVLVQHLNNPVRIFTDS